MHRVPQRGDPLEQVVLGGLDPSLGGRHRAGPGRYETLVEIGRHRGAPMLTFTAPDGVGHVEHTRPSDAYVATIAVGLKETRGWDDAAVASYVARLSPAA
jgi:hypothetical protein